VPHPARAAATDHRVIQPGIEPKLVRRPYHRVIQATAERPFRGLAGRSFVAWVTG